MQHHATTSQYELIEQRGDTALAGRSIVATKHNPASSVAQLSQLLLTELLPQLLQLRLGQSCDNKYVGTTVRQ